MPLISVLKRRKWRIVLAVFLGLLGVLLYGLSQPQVCNESFWGHAHCIKIAGNQFLAYADTHGGKYPMHPDGYGNALLLLEPGADFTLTGPGYTTTPFEEARRSGKGLAENDCGRIYIQGLTSTCDSRIVMLFDKLATPGDHCHFLARLFASPMREVLYCNGMMGAVPETEWPAFAREQVELLVSAGIRRDEAERMYQITSK